MIEIVSATRFSATAFRRDSALGLSLLRLRHDGRLQPRISFANRRGLPEIYNASIAASNASDILVFMHDDVWIDDYFFADRVLEGLRNYDVLGVAGNRRRMPGQPSWAFVDTKWTWDEGANLTGAVAQGTHPFGAVHVFGQVPAECELLDGVFLAARAATLREKQILFDPRFEFHFYDLDFCRSARERGLRLGTWPICLTHQSDGGGFRGPEWFQKYREYIEKWGN